MPRRLRTDKRRALTTSQWVLSTIGPGSGILRQVGAAEYGRLQKTWKKWDREHGLRWRLEHDVLRGSDLTEIWRRARAVEPARRLHRQDRPDPRLRPKTQPMPSRARVRDTPPPEDDAIRVQLDELLVEFPELFEGDPAPDPPGWDL